MQVPGLQISQTSWTVQVPGYVWSLNECRWIEHLRKCCAHQNALLNMDCPRWELQQKRHGSTTVWRSHPFTSMGPAPLLAPRHLSRQFPIVSFGLNHPRVMTIAGISDGVQGLAFYQASQGKLMYPEMCVMSCHVMPKQVCPGKKHQLRSRGPWPGIQDVSLITWASFQRGLNS